MPRARLVRVSQRQYQRKSGFEEELFGDELKIWNNPKWEKEDLNMHKHFGTYNT